MPTNDYHSVLNIVKEFHKRKKLYSGKFIRFYVQNIKQLIDELGCKTMLDYGCGKGMQWVTPFDPKLRGFIEEGEGGIPLEKFLGVKVTKYDPGVAEFSKEPEGKFDLVICTQVLGAIPARDIPWVVARMFSFAKKAVYVGEAGGATKKRWFTKYTDVLPGQWEAHDYENAVKGAASQFPGIPAWFRWRSHQMKKVS